MSGRPEILFPLFRALSSLDGIGPKTAMSLAKMGVNSPRDLLLTLPQSLIERSVRATIKGLLFPSVVSVNVVIGKHLPNQQKSRPYRINVYDSEENFQLVFFHARKDWLVKQFPEGQERVVSGKIEVFDSLAQMVHPDFVVKPEDISEIPEHEPVYPLTSGVTQKTMAKATTDVLKLVPQMKEWITPSVVKKYGFPDWNYAIETAHRPTSLSNVGFGSLSRQRLAYDEMLAHQMTLAISRHSARRSKGIASQPTGKLRSLVLDALPFKPTGAQLRSLDEINGDMAGNIKMNRLLQGDVGSGKTLVALLAMITAVEAKGQGVMMAPTEILASQHFMGLKSLADAASVKLEILTGRDKGKSRDEKLKALKNGEIQILVGTHAVFQKDVEFKDLRLAVIDEQHRFGVRQRMDLGNKGSAVDILVMTATPIPRSLALANYGDMDISVLDEKPAGRKPIETVMVSNSRIDQVIERLKTVIEQGKQAYWVCPLVEESHVVDLANAEDRYIKIRNALGKDNVGLVHGRLQSSDKDEAMADFAAGKTKVLVATTVIEVGVDVPNASIMVIEQAERFGLSQLHQLRGRVGRGADASTCLLMYAAPLGKTAQKRLEAIRETDDGFKISEVDLQLRGAGDVLGVAQSGLPRFRIADLEAQPDLMKTAQDEARLTLHEDPNLESERGKAIRTLMYFMGADEYIRLISIG